MGYGRQWRRVNAGTYRDILDGDIAEAIRAATGFGSEDGDIWIGINTDGVRVYRRGKKGAWPVWAINFNLPPSQRYKLKNLMLLGLYFGEDKPLMADFLKPLFRNLAERATVPFAVKFNGKPDPVLCRTQVIACPLDMDARWLVLNVQHNGTQSCCGCRACRNHHSELEGRKARRRFYYPAQAGTLRQAADWAAAAASLHAGGGVLDDDAEMEGADGDNDVVFIPRRGERHVNGLYGPSIAQLLHPTLFLRMVHDDPMHCIWLHVIPELVQLWTGKAHAAKPWSVRTSLGNINEILRLVTPPHGNQELPDDLEDANNWKAATSRFFALYLAGPVLDGILPDVYFKHLCKLIEILRYLCGPCVHENKPDDKLDLSRCEAQLAAWVLEFEQLYGKRFVSISMHMLVHLIATVRDCGPLWCSSCFSFESANHWLVRTAHAKRTGQDKALFDIFVRSCIGQELIDIYVNKDNIAFCKWLHQEGFAPTGSKPWFLPRGWTRVANGVIAAPLGSGKSSHLELKHEDLDDVGRAVFESFLGHPPTQNADNDLVWTFARFGRIKIDRGNGQEVFYSQQYAEKYGFHKKNSYCVYFKNGNSKFYGLVQAWMLDTSTRAGKLFALVKQFHIPGSPFLAVHPHPTIPNAFYFPKTAALPSIPVAVDDIEFKCIIHNLPNSKVNETEVYVITHQVFYQVGAVGEDDDDDEAAERGVPPLDEIM
eukprot:TRINITY_DN2275_c0_g1_i2.p1 TRINITY_DN2275_c0_g1~~TRINITY_DN2275_c0_g1_i2.p1  ORF type:complete len:711 (-),score=85.94 TRINITY_DN2275_c0_g1_i2:499-2631(-)